MVNDGSPDNAWAEISSIAKNDSHVTGIQLSRNFSQHRAIYAGLDHVDSDWTIVMDCDLQDQPEEILKLYQSARQGYDLVFGLRTNRRDTLLKKLGSRLFTWVLGSLTETPIRADVTNFSILSYAVLSNLRKMREQNAYYILNLYWLGFTTSFIPVEHSERAEGKSSYTMKMRLRLAFDILVSHSNKPLRLMVKLGFILALIAMSYAIWLIIRYYYFEIPLEGWTSLMVSIYLMGGVLLANMGILGLYIGKSFDEQKNRPLYIVKEVCSRDKKYLND